MKHSPRYQVIQLENGFFGVTDKEAPFSSKLIAAGMSESAARLWADRLMLRHAWGI